MSKAKKPRDWHAVNAMQRHAGPMNSRKRAGQAERRDTEEQLREPETVAYLVEFKCRNGGLVEEQLFQSRRALEDATDTYGTYSWHFWETLRVTELVRKE